MDKRTAAFARRLHAALEHRQLLGHSDGELARLLARHHVAVSPQTVGNWRNGKHMPKLEQFPGLAALLKVDPGELAFGKPGSAVAEQPNAYAGLQDEDQLLQAYGLLDAPRRALVKDLVVLLSAPGVAAKRPGRRKTPPAKRPGPVPSPSTGR